MIGPVRRLRAFRTRWRATHDAVRSMAPSVSEARDHSAAALDRAEHAVAVADGAQAAVDRLSTANADLSLAVRRLEGLRRRDELHARVAPTMQWLERAEVPVDTLVSIVLPTRNRVAQLERAIRSVLEQRHSRWQLVVVDDGDEQDAAAMVEDLDDGRITYVRNKGTGVSSARNTGLDLATGDLVTYLDDDNLMHPLWLTGVIWAFEIRPDVHVVYGARIVESPTGLSVNPFGPFPTMQLEPFHRRKLEEGNFIDLGTVAHRPGIPEARFDEDLEAYVDWDLLLRLTRKRPAVAIPVIACSYSTSAPDRIQNRRTHRSAHDTVRSRLAADRPLRVLAYNPLMPLLSETYIEDELEALCQVNADLVYARTIQPPANIDMAVDRPVYEGLDAALAEYDPDLLFIHWFTFAREALPTVASSGLPFAVRAHGYDFDPEVGAELLAHPSCVGVWTYPHFTSKLPGAKALPTIFTSVDQLPAPAATRDLVMSASAGLPKKDFPLLIDAMARMDGVEREVMIATAYLTEELPGQVHEMASRYADPPHLRVDAPRREVFAKLSRAAALIYTLHPEQRFGNPMSVVEGLCAGTSVILPDRPEARTFAGPAARFYTTADDIVAHVKEIVGGGEAVEQERLDNRAHGMRAFADPLIGRRFYAELVESLEGWRRNRFSRPS